MDGFFLKSSMFFDVFLLKKDQYTKDAQYLVFESVLNKYIYIYICKFWGFSLRCIHVD